MTEPIDLGRRHFIIATAAAGGGLALGFSPLTTQAVDAGAKVPTVQEMSPWLVISPDGTITVRVSLTESGNGVVTQQAMTVAEELCCDWSRVRTEPASVQRDVTDGFVYSRPQVFFHYFAGRSTAPGWLVALRQVGANARERLKLAAAQYWQVPVMEIDAKDSLLTHRSSGRTLGYGAMAEAAARVTLDREPALKPPSEWTLLGRKSPGKLHNPAVVTGTAQFGIDVRLPDMLYAALMQTPVQGGRLKRYDDSKARAMPGVRAVVVVDPDEPRPQQELRMPDVPWANPAEAGIAVIADHYWQARKALDALEIEWDDGVGAQCKTEKQIEQAARALLEMPGRTATRTGDPDQAMKQQATVVEATYMTPYCDHATMEPLNGTALVTADRVDLWHPTALADTAQHAAAHEAGLPREKVYVHPTLMGGQFGRRTASDDVRMVVAVARKYPGRPIHVIWSREESMRHGRYRAHTVTRLKMGLDRDGMPQAFLARTAGRSFKPPVFPEDPFDFWSTAYGLALSPYASVAIPHSRIEYHNTTEHIRTGAYRGPGYNQNIFILESFIDECARAAGIDPLEYRLQLLSRWPDPGVTQCLKVAAEKAGWGRPLKRGMGRGIAVALWGSDGQPKAGTTVCAVATVQVSKRGQLRVRSIDLSFDSGKVLNRDAVHAQLQGGAVFGLNMTLNEGLTIRDGRIVEGNFDTYPMLRMADMPKINIHFGALSGDDRFGEIGEPATGVVGPAIANAIFQATGQRIRATPLRKQDLRWS